MEPAVGAAQVDTGAPRSDNPTGITLSKQIVSHALAAVLVLACATSGGAKEGSATAAEATALVRKGVACIKANGNEKGYSELSNKAGRFVDRDLYLMDSR
jgi:cytochrome c